MKLPSMTLTVVVTKNKQVLGLKCDGPLSLALLALLAQEDANAPRVQIVLADATVQDWASARLSPDCDSVTLKRPGKMDATLRARSESPDVIVPNIGEVGAMLSILSDRLSSSDGGKK